MDISSAWNTGRIALGAGALLIAAATGAQAAPLSQSGATWLDPTAISATGAWAGEARVAGDADNGIAVWTSGRAGAWRVEAARVTAGQVATAQDISGTLSTAPRPDAAVRGDSAAVAWETDSGIAVRSGAPSGFAATTTLPGAGAARPSVTFDSQGRAWAAWTQADGIYVARNDGAWQSLGRIVAGANPRTVDIAAHGDGIAMTWSQPASTAARPRWTVRAALVTSAGVQDVDLDLAASASAPQPRIASGGGVLGVTWRREGFVGPNANYYADSVQVATHAGSWSRTQVHAPRVAMRVINPEIAISLQGEMAVTYTRSSNDITTTDYRDAGMLLVVRTRATNGSWSGERTLLYARDVSHTTKNSAAMNARPRFDASGGLAISWTQTASGSVGQPVAASAARMDDGTWSLRGISPTGATPEWVTLLPAAGDRDAVAIWRRHLGGGAFVLSASRFGVPPVAAPPAQVVPAPAPAPTPSPGPIGPITREQAQSDAAAARAALRTPGARPTITVTLRRAGRVSITLRPINRANSSTTRWQVRAGRGTTRIRLDQSGVAAGRYRAEARVGSRVVARRTVTISTDSVRAMGYYRAQTGWISADTRIIAVSGNRLTLDMLAAGTGAGSWFGTTIDIAPDFMTVIGAWPLTTAPIRITLDVQENTATISGTVFEAGRRLRVLISGATTLDVDSISSGQLVEATNGCIIIEPCS